MSRLRGVNVRAALVGFVLVALVAGSILGLTQVVRPPAQDRRAAPGTAWLSGEARGRAVLAAPGSQLGSVAVALGTEPTVYDVAELSKVTAVFDRHAGSLALLDPVLGAIKDRQARLATREQASLVPAGSAAYIVDRSTRSARKVAGDGKLSEAVNVGSFTEVVGTNDGVLWLLDAHAGTYTSFDGTTTPTPIRLTNGEEDLTLSAIGRDPVVLDRQTQTLRWLRRGSTVPVNPATSAGGLNNGGSAGGEKASLTLQRPDLAGYSDCATVVVGAVARCFSSHGALREANLRAEIGGASEVFSGLAGLVVAEPGVNDVQVGQWGQTLTAATRNEPSTRDMTAWSTPTAILVDDPGSRYAFTASGATSVGLDKFSRKTVVLTPDGPQIDLGAQANDIQVKVPTPGFKPKDQQANQQNNKQGNLAPTPQPDEVRTREDRAVKIDVLANDSDPNGDPLVIVETSRTNPSGDVTILNGARVLFRPAAGYLGKVTFTYTVADPGGLRASADVTVDVLSKDQNTAPEPQDDDATTTQNVPVVIPVLANDTDPEGDPLSIIAIGRPLHGTVGATDDGFLRYEPDRDFTGNDLFVYTVVDGYGGRAEATVRVTVSPPTGANRPPIAQDDRATVVAGKHVRVQVLQNDSDPDGDPIHVVSIGNVFGLTATILGGGQAVDIVPDLRTAGVVSLPYTIEDSNGAKASAQIALVVEPPTPNRPPQAIDDSFVDASDVQVIDVVANDVDPDGDPLTIVDVTQPTVGGAVTKSSATTLRVVPTQGYTGTLKFTYTISDPDGLRSTGNVTVEVVPPTGSGPIARDDIARMFEGESVTIPVLANDTHPDGLPFGLSGPPVVRAGTAVVNPDGTISYTAPAGQTGTFTMSYTIRDFYGRTATAQVIITVDARPASGGGGQGPENHPPIASNDHAVTAFQTPVQIDVVANDTDPDYQALTVTAVTPGTGGTPAIVTVPPAPNASTTQVRFTPASGFSGLASFTYTVSDTGGLSATATVVVDVAKKLLVAPIARDDLATVNTGATVTIDPRTNDLDPDGSSNALRVTDVKPGTGITASIDSNGLVRIVGPPNAGNYDIAYTITDPDGLTGSGNIAVHVVIGAGGNHPPTPLADSATTAFQTAVSIPVLANDTDPDGGTLSVTAVTQPASGGTATIQAPNVVFTPANGFTGNATFTYTVADPQGATATADVTVTVTACAASTPVLADDVASTKFNTPVTFDLFANDTKATGTLTLSKPSAGTVAVATPGTGSVTYTPPPTFNGTATFTYTVTPPCGQPATASVTVTVNHPPVANPDTVVTPINTPVVIAVVANDTDPDGDALRIFGWANIAGGTVDLVANTQTLRFTPVAGFTGTAGFTYEVQDVGGLRSSAAVTVNVTAPNNHPPVAKDDTADTTPGTPVDIAVLANDTDPDGDPLQISDITGVGQNEGTVQVVGTGSVAKIRFTPANGFNGTARFRYTVVDTSQASDVGRVTVNVAPVQGGNQPPVARDDVDNVTPGSAGTSVPVLNNDSDPDGDPITFASPVPGSVIPAGAGTAVIQPNGTILFVPGPSFAGSARFTYLIQDSHGATATGTVTMNAAASNGAPTAVSDQKAAAASAQAQTVTVDVIANDTDPDGDLLFVSSAGGVTPPDAATVANYGGRFISVTISPNFTGTLSIPYTVSDGRGGTSTAELKIVVT